MESLCIIIIVLPVDEILVSELFVVTVGATSLCVCVCVCWGGGHLVVQVTVSILYETQSGWILCVEGVVALAASDITLKLDTCNMLLTCQDCDSLIPACVGYTYTYTYMLSRILEGICQPHTRKTATQSIPITPFAYTCL